jgi:hypothetical protein
MSAERPDYVENRVVKLDKTPYVSETAGSVRKRAARFGGGKGGGGVETTIPIKDYIDARDDAVEARLSSKLDGVLSELSKLPKVSDLEANRRSTVNNIWGGVAAVLGVILAFLAFGGDRFDGGMSVSPVIAQVQQSQKTIDESQDAKQALLDDKLDIVIKQTAGK